MGNTNFTYSVYPFCDVIKIVPQVHKDKRGYFFESFNLSTFPNDICGLEVKDFVQDNQSCSAKGVMRGLHYQTKPHAQDKLVRCTSGKILDFMVDIRHNSSTYGRAGAVLLTPDGFEQVYIPAGYAHGFLALEDNSILQYKVTDYYDKDCDRSIFMGSEGIIGLDFDMWRGLAGVDHISYIDCISDKDLNAIKFSEYKLNPDF